MLSLFHTMFVHVAAACGATTDPGFFGFPTWYAYLGSHVDAASGACVVDFDMTKIPLVLLAVVDILLRIAALVAVAFVVVGGIKYTTSQGDPQAAANARETIIGSVAGLAIASVAATLVSFIGNKFGG